MISKTFCILPWIHFYANPDGSVLPCCIGDHNIPLGNVQQNSISEIWNSKQYKTMRLNMLSGKRCSECTSCYRTEDAGVNSFRESVNRDYSEFLDIAEETNLDGSLDTMKLKYLDIRWSNICNFKCRSCSGTYSSSWATEDNRHGQNKKVFIYAGGENNTNLYSQLKPHLRDVKEIYFAGGEPLLMDKHYEILEHLIQTGNTDIKIRYNSNLSSLTFKNLSVIKLWKNFSNIQLNVSLDSWANRAEYIREGTHWDDIETNINRIKEECSHVTIGISSVISIFNVYTVPEFIEYMINTKLVDNNIIASFYCLTNPNFYSFDILDTTIKETIIDKLTQRQYNEHIDPQIKNIIKHLKSSIYNPTLQRQFKKHTDYYDSIRNKKFVDTFPELKEFYENIL
jgi:radical SAM protein with 4Fe4S-binding SPASM domain